MTEPAGTSSAGSYFPLQRMDIAPGTLPINPHSIQPPS